MTLPRLALGAALAAVLLTPAPARAQDPDLRRALDAVAAMWARGDAIRLVAVAAERGIELEVHGEAMGRVSGRKASAALRDVFSSQETVAVRARMTSRVAGTEDTAFGELTWEVRARGGGVNERSTVFVGMVREGRAWKVSQIRVMR